MAEKLFPGEDPVGQDMRIGGTRLTVIGVFVKFGDDMMGMSMDESVLIPLAMARNFVNLHWSGTEMVVKGPDGGDVQELKADVGSIMRRLRRFGPRTEDNFAVNEMSILSNQLDNMFRRINFAGGGEDYWDFFDPGGGFGVANIMFVSVRERTAQIGIQKALGETLFCLVPVCFRGSYLFGGGRCDRTAADFLWGADRQ